MIPRSVVPCTVTGAEPWRTCAPILRGGPFADHRSGLMQSTGSLTPAMVEAAVGWKQAGFRYLDGIKLMAMPIALRHFAKPTFCTDIFAGTMDDLVAMTVLWGH